MIDFLKTYIVFILLHRWNKVSEEHFDFLEKYWDEKPTKGIELWLYNKVKYKNGVFK